MSEASAVTVLTRKSGQIGAHHGMHLASLTQVAPTTLTFDGVGAVEIVAPDRHCAMLLLDAAGQAFRAELIADTAWIVRFQQPPTGGDWVIEVLGLVEGWLHTASIPCAKVRHAGSTYLIRAPLDAA